MKPRLLDLFCGAGGAAMGYHRAGFEVVGVDINPQPHYPFEFWKADALDVLRGLSESSPLRDKWAFDAIHASPPCQAYSHTKYSHRKKHPELLEPTLELLATIQLPWVVENVPLAPVPDPVVLCGAAFDLITDDADGTPLVLKRHRLFGSNLLLLGLPCGCKRYRDSHRIAGAYGGGSQDRNHAQFVRRGGYTPRGEIRGRLLGIDWMTQSELSQAIPPAYTEWIGRQLIAAIERAAA